MRRHNCEYNYRIEYTIVFQNCAYTNTIEYNTNANTIDNAKQEFITNKLNGDRSIKHIFVNRIKVVKT